jgi:mannose/fructose-specific phosphotransferase system component IIA
MTPLLILTHGDFGPALLKAAEAMLGPQAQTQALALALDETRESFAERTAAAMAALPSAPLALVDIACGTPWNVAVTAGCASKGDVLAGLSLPILMEALSLRGELGPLELAAELKKRAPEALQRAAELLARRADEGC